jgi:hypothetical protein
MSRIKLYSKDDKKNPIVRFRKSLNLVNRKVDPPTTDARPAMLLLSSKGVEIQDIAVISFLVLEKSRRATESSTINRADSAGLAPGVLGKHQ